MIIPILSAILLTVGSVGIEEKNNSEKLVLSLPLKRSTIVLSKYMSVMIYFGGGMLLAVLFGSLLVKIGIARVLKYVSFDDVILSLMITILYASLYLPIIFKLGYKQSRLYVFMMVMLPSMATLIISDYPDLTKKLVWLSYVPHKMLMFGVFLFLFMIYGISMFFSVRFYEKRDF
jgi:ABC-type transport system involved in multi-copper enzyme maturation permease subunit